MQQIRFYNQDAVSTRSLQLHLKHFKRDAITLSLTMRALYQNKYVVKLFLLCHSLIIVVS